MVPSLKDQLFYKKQGLKFTRFSSAALALNIGTILSQGNVSTLGKFSITASGIALLAGFYYATDLKFDIEELEDEIKSKR